MSIKPSIAHAHPTRGLLSSLVCFSPVIFQCMWYLFILLGFIGYYVIRIFYALQTLINIILSLFLWFLGIYMCVGTCRKCRFLLRPVMLAPPKAGVAGNCEIPNVDTRNWTRVLWKNKALLLTTKPSLWPCHLSCSLFNHILHLMNVSTVCSI